MVDHVSDLNVTVSYGPVYSTSDGSFISNVSVEVPYLTSTSRKGNQSFCPSAYLIDFVRPVRRDRSLTFIATADALGRAQTSCAATNFTYDPATFIFPDTSPNAAPYGKAALREGWGLRLRTKEARAMYYRTTPLSLKNMVEECGAVKRGQRYEWDLHVCQAGYYGRSCQSFIGEYALSCAGVKGVVDERGGDVVSLSTVRGGRGREEIEKHSTAPPLLRVFFTFFFAFLLCVR